MSQSSDLLDLSITLTPPPAGSPPETLATITLQCSAPLGLSHTGDLLKDPLSAQEREDLRWYLEEYWKWPFEGFAERGKRVEALLPQIGERLYQAVFGSFKANSLLQAWRLRPETQRQISIISELPRALSLPWELLHDEQGYLVLRTRNPVVLLRRLPQGEAASFAMPFEPPLRVLLVTARPEEAGFIDPRSTARELLDEVEEQVEQGTIAVEFLRPPTLSALRARLRDSKRPAIHLLHFDGHGTFRPDQQAPAGSAGTSAGEGLLAFEDEEGKLDLVEASEVAQVLQDSGVHLVLLDACQSAMSSDEALSSVAARLIQSGVDAVVAMSASVLVTSSTRYMEAFYRELAAGTAAPVAQERARQALHDDPRRGLVARRSSEEGTSVELRDWWLPHFYQQRPLILRPARGARKKKPEHTASSLPRFNSEMPAAPRYGFSGRARELLVVERHLLRGKLVVLFGFGGIGKTALAREAADWLTRTGMYTGACFVSFEHGGEASTLLSALAHFLGVYDSTYNPQDTTTALAHLKPALKAQRTLLIADNLESLLPAGEAPLDPATRTQLWNVLLDLSRLGAGVLLTSRDTAFGDGRLAPGKLVAHLALGGLYPADAYTLATGLLADLGIDRKRASYPQLQELLRSLDYHPLAIQLVLPILRQSSLTRITSDFAALLPQFQDDTATGRNSSLLASLQYSLQRLSPEHRALLPRLALFEGGASEDDLLAITQISDSEWATLRPALEQAALLSAEQVHEVIPSPFLRFHPVLAPSLRSQPGANDAALRQRYRQCYYALAAYLYQQDVRHPQPVRALVRRELPNLRRALTLLLEDGEVDVASEMADCIAKFLNNFGLRRELEELRRRVEEAVAKQSETQAGEALTRAEWLRERGRGEDEFTQGDLRAAFTRFSFLLARIEAQPVGAPLGRGSYEHCLTLGWLARCLSDGGRPDAAEMRLREALSIIEVLLKEQPENKSYTRQRGALLTELGDVLSDQGKYPEAQEAYAEALKVYEHLGDVRGQAVDLGQLGTLALMQRDYKEAHSRYIAALAHLEVLGEPASEAVIWHQLGMVAQRQQQWAEAEHYYRESLLLEERMGDTAGTAQTCNQLAIVARDAGRPSEAEGWYKRALELDEQVQPGGPGSASDLSNLAYLLENEVRAGRAPTTRLAEARRYAERALAIDETLDASSGIWTTLSILADIAELEGRTEEARAYRHREREAFSAFAGNRYHIDRQHGQLIAAIAAAATGDKQAREAVEARLPRLEANGWHIAAAVRHIWAGEREWHGLVEGVDSNSALLVRRVLETLGQDGEMGT